MTLSTHICGLFTLFDSATLLKYLVQGNYHGGEVQEGLCQLNSELFNPKFYSKFLVNLEIIFVKGFNRSKFLGKTILRIDSNGNTKILNISSNLSLMCL